MSKIVYSINSYDEVIKESGEWPTTKLGALKESIRKWKWLRKYLNTADIVPLSDWRSCALCDLYLFDGDGSCDGCPVKHKTGKEDCSGTPYYEYTNAEMFQNTSEAKEAADKEIVFLESLVVPVRKSSKRKPVV